ncbi:hypothetical protein B1R96_06620 [Priestia aryabhattai]|nr:hypothetical protein B1R96_06620 [Priestia aryabhattai]
MNVGFLYVAVDLVIFPFLFYICIKVEIKKKKENTYAKTANKRNPVLSHSMYDWKCGSLFR